PSQPSLTILATLSRNVTPDAPFDTPDLLADLNDDFHRRGFGSFFAARLSEPPRNSNERRSNPLTPPTRLPSRTSLQTTSTTLVDVVSRRSSTLRPVSKRRLCDSTHHHQHARRPRARTAPTRLPSRTTLKTTSTILVDVVSRRSRPCGPSRNPGYPIRPAFNPRAPTPLQDDTQPPTFTHDAADDVDDPCRRRFAAISTLRPLSKSQLSDSTRLRPHARPPRSRTTPTRLPSRWTLQTTPTILVDVVSRRSRPCGPRGVLGPYPPLETPATDAIASDPHATRKRTGPETPHRVSGFFSFSRPFPGQRKPIKASSTSPSSSLSPTSFPFLRPTSPPLHLFPTSFFDLRYAAPTSPTSLFNAVHTAALNFLL
ncbi:hypothetical protein H0H87_006877, partial [Tephrocybe sp. NHM501043]